MVDRPVSLRTLAKMAGASTEEVADLNPALVRGTTPPDREGYRIRVPEGTKQIFEFAYARMIQEARQVQAVAQVRPAGATYKVRRGDTVAAIAKRYNVSVTTLKQINGWQNANNLQAGTVVRLPGAPAKPTSVRVASKSSRARRVN